MSPPRWVLCALLATVLIGCAGGWPFTPQPDPSSASLAPGASSRATSSGSASDDRTIDTSPPPSRLEIAALVGETLEFTDLCPTCSVFEVDARGRPLPHDPNAMTGPPRVAPGGVYAYIRNGVGWVERPASERCTCGGRRGCDPVVSGGRQLCPDRPKGSTGMPAMLDHPAVSGWVDEFGWKELCPSRTCDFSPVGEMLDMAAAHGKVAAVLVRGGYEENPEWLEDAGVKLATFTAPAAVEDDRDCGATGKIGTPMDARYLEESQRLVRELAAWLRKDGRRYQTLARFEAPFVWWKTVELRLPASQIRGCPDNAATWKKLGYTPQALYSFTRTIFETERDAFPGKAIGYGFLQGGLPDVGDRPADQATRVLETFTDVLGTRALPSHKGARDSKELNRWIADLGNRGKAVGFQSVNDLPDAPAALATLRRISDGSSGSRVAELYEAPLWRAIQENGDAVDAVAKKLRSRAAEDHPATWSYRFTAAGDRYFMISGSNVVHHVAVTAR